MSTVPFPELDGFARYGYLGVNLFFMISGFVILLSADGRSPRQFFIMRVLRLYPAFWLCCTITFFITIGWGNPHFATTSFEYLVNLTMLANYFSVLSVDGAYWSLYVELNFYLLVFLFLRYGKKEKMELYLNIWLLFSFLSYWFSIGGILEIFLRPSYAPYFISGGFFYLIYFKGNNLRRTLSLISGFITVSLYSISEVKDVQNYYRTQYSSNVVFLIVCCFFLIFILLSKKKLSFLKNPKFVILGMITYPLYLIHQKVGFILLNNLYPIFDKFVILVLVVTGLILLSYIVAAYYEKPLMRLGREKLKKLKQFGGAL